jgi:hypothetical protein
MRAAIGTLAVAAFLSACGAGAGPTDAGGVFPEQPFTRADSNSGALHLALRSLPQPPARGQDTVRLGVTDDGGNPVDGLELSVQPWMPVMGHGSSVVPTVTGKGQGDYDVSNLYLAMPGTWELRVAVSGKASDGATPSFQVP